MQPDTYPLIAGIALSVSGTLLQNFPHPKLTLASRRKLIGTWVCLIGWVSLLVTLGMDRFCPEPMNMAWALVSTAGITVLILGEGHTLQRIAEYKATRARVRERLQEACRGAILAVEERNDR